MESKLRFNRCCNPLELENHPVSKGLRRASIKLQELWNLNRFDYLCSSCRKKLGFLKSVPSTSTYVSSKSDDSDTECDAEDNNVFVDNVDIHDIVLDDNDVDDDNTNTGTDNCVISEPASTVHSFSSGIFIFYRSSLILTLKIILTDFFI